MVRIVSLDEHQDMCEHVNTTVYVDAGVEVCDDCGLVVYEELG